MKLLKNKTLRHVGKTKGHSRSHEIILPDDAIDCVRPLVRSSSESPLKSFLKLIHNLWQNFNDKLLFRWSQRAKKKLKNSMKSFIDRKSERTKLRNSFRLHHIMKAHKPQRMVTDIHFLNINYSSFYFTFSFFHLGLETLVERIQNSSVLWMIFSSTKSFLWFEALGKERTRKHSERRIICFCLKVNPKQHKRGAQIMFSESFLQQFHIRRCWMLVALVRKPVSRLASSVILACNKKYSQYICTTASSVSRLSLFVQ